MVKVSQYLKPVWVKQLVELAAPLLPVGSSLALLLDGRCLLAVGESGASLTADSAGIVCSPLTLDDSPVGTLLLLPSADQEISARTWAAFFAHVVQGMLDAEHARRAVGQQTLESYREIALLQRAVTDLNRSLKPAEVAGSLLKEFEGHKGGCDFGAVFLRDTDSGNQEQVAVFGIGGMAAFAAFRQSPLFAEIAEGTTGDIVSDLAMSPHWQEGAYAFRSLLWLPLIAHGENLGLLVLASLRDKGFAAGDMKRAQTLTSVAATALRNAQLYAAEQKMFHTFVRVIATAIDAKSPYTAGHCRRVPEIAMMLAEAAHRAEHGPFADFRLDEDERNALQIAALLHDCGKVVTPEWVVDKASKLDRITNRIELVAMRFELLRRDADLDFQRALAAGADHEAAKRERNACLKRLDDDFAFVDKCNAGSEFVSADSLARLKEIARISWRDANGMEQPLLTDDEVYNLAIQRGTLNAEERKVIEDHAVHTFNMLSQIPFPHALRNVTEYAANHHERMDGTGYPRRLRGGQLSIPARIVAIADIFEALTAPDRPYRKPSTLGWAVGVMHRMKQDGHIDGDLFDLLLSENIHMEYARKNLVPSQIDGGDVVCRLG